MDTAKFQPLAIPKGLIERLDVFLESKDANNMGLTTRPQVVSMLLREFLEKWEAERSKK